MIKCLVISKKPYLFDALSTIDFISSKLKLTLAEVFSPGFALVISDIKFSENPYESYVIEFTDRPIILTGIIQEIEKYIHSRSKQLNFAGVTLNTVTRKLNFKAKTSQLTELECKILAALIASKSHTLSRDEIKTSILGYSEGVETSTIENHIYHLRQKISTCGAKLKIENSGGEYVLYAL
jgi:hypothetical protein